MNTTTQSRGERTAIPNTSSRPSTDIPPWDEAVQRFTEAGEKLSAEEALDLLESAYLEREKVMDVMSNCEDAFEILEAQKKLEVIMTRKTQARDRVWHILENQGKSDNQRSEVFFGDDLFSGSSSDNPLKVEPSRPSTPPLSVKGGQNKRPANTPLPAPLPEHPKTRVEEPEEKMATGDVVEQVEKIEEIVTPPDVLEQVQTAITATDPNVEIKEIERREIIESDNDGPWSSAFQTTMPPKNVLFLNLAPIAVTLVGLLGTLPFGSRTPIGALVSLGLSAVFLLCLFPFGIRVIRR